MPVTAFKFLHAADLHLGSPFRGLAVRDSTTIRRFAEAGRAAFADLVSRAIAEKVAFVVIAGDVYDGDWPDLTIGLFFARELGRLERAGIEVFLLRGDEDAASVVARNVRLPASVKSFATEVPSTFRIESLRVALHGQGFREPVVTDNLVLNYPERVAGWFNVGVLHTSLTGRPTHAEAVPCTPGHLRARGYDYWALGHAHEFEIVSTKPYIVFPGNIQGCNAAETGEKGAVLVSVDDGTVTSVERVIVDRARWADVTVDMRGAASTDAAMRAIEEAIRPLASAAAERPTILHLRLTGESEAHRRLLADANLRDAVQAAAQRIHGDLWLEAVEIATRPPVQQTAPDTALGAIDLDSLLATVLADSSVTDKARELLAEVRARIPATIPESELPAEGGVGQILAEARELLLTRAQET